MAVGQSNNVVAIVQARMGSSRLKGKVLKTLPFSNELTILDHVVLRAAHSKSINSVIVATSDLATDDPIEELCLKNNYNIFRGDEDDVLDRYIHASKMLSKDDCIIRLTADNPFIDFEIIDFCVKKHFELSSDYSYTNSLPLGMNIELIRKSTLDKVGNLANKQSYREHVTSYIKDFPDNFRINILQQRDYKCPLRLTVDYPSDYALACYLYKELYKDNNFFGLNELENFFIDNPWILFFNNMNVQK